MQKEPVTISSVQKLKARLGGFKRIILVNFELQKATEARWRHSLLELPLKMLHFKLIVLTLRSLMISKLESPEEDV